MYIMYQCLQWWCCYSKVKVFVLTLFTLLLTVLFCTVTSFVCVSKTVKAFVSGDSSVTVGINKFLFSFSLFSSSSNSTDGQQSTQQSPPTVEVTPPDSQPEDNGVMEEQTDGEWLYWLYQHCFTPLPLIRIQWTTSKLNYYVMLFHLFYLCCLVSCQDKERNIA